jgi:transcription-repair coupling factor (superfamily II helicase)
MRDELRDRFGEYPEEVEHLFSLLELKVLAAQIGFAKIEFQNDRLSLFFPPADTKEFYEESDGSTSRFQQIMSHVSDLKRYGAGLRQEGQQLRLTAPLEHDTEPRARLKQVRSLLERLQYQLAPSPPMSQSNIPT